jgi:hypothetical protein
MVARRCVEPAVVEGPMAALDDRPRPGREPTITLEAKAWLTLLSCRNAKELGYPHEFWTTRLLARHAREEASTSGLTETRLMKKGEWSSTKAMAHFLHYDDEAKQDAQIKRIKRRKQAAKK